MTTYSNAQEAFLAELARLDASGTEVTVRGTITREVLGRTFVVEKPLERCIIVPSRLNNIAATIVESMWVLAGRNDLKALEPYLPRVKDFSDDGTHWRAGYGPRLRDWRGVDQVDCVRRLLLADPTTRRGVISLFDPAVDYLPSVDIPCNNWLHFVRRGDSLDMFIAVRSNDIIWGFSGINSFEWSVLHELMASWIGADVGRQHWSVSSMHIYDRHFERSAAILETAMQSPRHSYPPRAAGYEGRFDRLDSELATWFEFEAAIRAGQASGLTAASHIADPLFRAFLDVIDSFWASKRGDVQAVRGSLARLGQTDLGLAATEYVSRVGNHAEPCLYRTESTLNDVPDRSTDPLVNDARGQLKALHAKKSAVYGDSWKRRGELLGVLANIARKVDRLANRSGSSTADGETQRDTLSDLLIYLLKYQTFLADRDSSVFEDLFNGHVKAPASDGNDGLEYLLETVQPTVPVPSDAVEQLARTFEDLLGMAQNAPEGVSDRVAVASQLSELSFGLLISNQRA